MYVTSLTLAIKKWQELVTIIRGGRFFNLLNHYQHTCMFYDVRMYNLHTFTIYLFFKLHIESI